MATTFSETRSRPAAGTAEASYGRKLALWLRASLARVRAGLVQVAPLLVVLALILGVGELAGGRPGATLPAPSAIWASSGELITDPFYDRGGLDKGLFWHLLSSLQRVVLGFALSGAAGIALGMLVGTSPLAMRGLDPIF